LNDVDSSGTCFNILANNVTLDCQGYTINYSQSAQGYAINNTLGYNYTTIKNCDIVKNSNADNAHAIYFEDSYFGNVSNNNITTTGGYNGKGITLYSSPNATLSNNEITTSSGDAHGIFIFSSPYSKLTSNKINTSLTNSLLIYAWQTADHYNHDIDTSNLAEGLPILYYFDNNSDVIQDQDYTNTYGQVIFAWSKNITIENVTMSNDGFSFFNVSNSKIENSKVETIKGDGIFLYSNSRNNTISNNNITVSGNTGVGIYIRTYCSNNMLSNNNVTTSGSSGFGIWILGTSSNNTIINNNINTSGTWGYGVYFGDSPNNILSSSSIKTANTNARGVVIASSSNSRIIGSTINATSAYDIRVEGTYGYTSYIINCTFNQSDVGFTGSATDKIEVQWYLDVYVNSSIGSSISQANVTAWMNNGTQTFNELTDGTGYITRQELTEYTHNASQVYPDNVTYFTNYTVNATKSGFTENTTEVNLTESKMIYLTLTDIEYPQYYNDSTNNTNAGEPTEFSLYWTDNVGLSGYIFSTNNTGEWINDTLVDFESRDNNAIFFDGFESGDLSVWTGTNGDPTVVSSEKYHGDYSLECNASGNFSYKNIPDQDTVFVRGYFKFSNLPTTTGELRFMRLANGTGAWGDPIARLRLRYTGAAGLTLTLYYYYPNYTYVNYDIDMDANKWYPFEMSFVRHETEGEYRVWFDGKEVITSTGLNTSNASGVNKVIVGMPYISDISATTWVDRVVISNSYIGPDNQAWSNITLPHEITPDDSTVLLFHLNNQSAYGENDTFVYDFSGNGNNGTVENATWTSSGRIGGAFEFDGVDDFVNISNSSSLTGDFFSNENWTFQAWVKPTLTGDGWQGILNGVGGDDIAVFLSTTSGFSLRGNVGGEWTILCEENDVFTANIWQLVTVVSNSTNYTIYKNGEVMNSCPYNQTDGGNSYYKIGEVASNENFNGTIDEVAVYNRSLTAVEIKAHYMAGYPLNSTVGTVVGWRVYANDTTPTRL